MSIDNFIPTVWAGSILRNLHRVQVFTSAIVCNRDYEGEIADQGNSVKINNIGPVTIGNYTKNTNINDPETLTSAQQTLNIDQAKYFNFAVDDVDKAQTKPKVMDEANYEAAWGFADAADSFVASFYAQADAGNLLGSDTTPLVINAANLAYENLVDMGTALDTANIPRMGRWAVIPPWYYGLILKDQRFVSFGTASNIQTLMSGLIGGAQGDPQSMMMPSNGVVGEAAGFKILMSNNVQNTTNTKYKIMAGYNKAISFADQIVKTVAYRPEKRFADAMKGLHVYGAKVIRPTGMAVATCNRS